MRQAVLAMDLFRADSDSSPFPAPTHAEGQSLRPVEPSRLRSPGREPILLTTVSWAGRAFRFNKMQKLDVEEEDGHIFVSLASLELEGDGEDLDEAISSFSEMLSIQYREIADESDETKLTPGAKELRRRLLALVRVENAEPST